MKLIETFGNSPEETKEEKRVNEALESAEQYLRLGVFQELASIIQKTDQEIREVKEKIEETLEKKMTRVGTYSALIRFTLWDIYGNWRR